MMKPIHVPPDLGLSDFIELKKIFFSDGKFWIIKQPNCTTLPFAWQIRTTQQMHFQIRTVIEAPDNNTSNCWMNSGDSPIPWNFTGLEVLKIAHFLNF